LFIQETLTQSNHELPAVTLVNDGIQTENLHKTLIVMNELGFSWNIVLFVIIWKHVVQLCRMWRSCEPSYWQWVCRRSLLGFFDVDKAFGKKRFLALKYQR